MNMNSHTPHHAPRRGACAGAARFTRSAAYPALLLLLTLSAGCEDPKPPVVELSVSEPLALGVPITILNLSLIHI